MLILCTSASSSADDAGDTYGQDTLSFSDDGRLDPLKMIRVPFPGVSEKATEWKFPYSDGFFSIPSDEFSVATARGSMGLTVSAFRSTKGTVDLQYRTYLREAGFTNIYAFGYDSPTSVDSLSGVIGMKRIGDFTVIAASACGQGYGNEWASNMKVGNGSRHEGFSKAAALFSKYLQQYIADNGIEGKKKLWITGFSRASAVGNILAADMIASGEYEDVYAYLFGVPRTTKEPVKYKGIYNICGQYDPVPSVPLQTWGYERYGTDIFTPAQESDAGYSKLADSARAVGEKLDGKGFRNNPEVNYQIRLIVECFGELFPESRDYYERLQDTLEDVMINHDSEHLLDILPGVLAKLEPENAQDKAKIDTLVDYIGYIAGRHLRAEQGQVEENGWDPTATTVGNSALEHLPITYMKWLFSGSEPQELFSSCIVTRRLTFIGKVDVAVLKDGEEIGRIDKNGKGVHPEVFMTRSENETVVSLPGDEEYYVTLGTDKKCTVSMYDLVVSPANPVSESDKINLYRLAPGRYGFRVTPGEPISAAPEVIKGDYSILGTSDYEYSAASVMNDELKATSHSYLSLKNAYRLVRNVVVGLIVFLLACLISNLYHRYKVRRGHPPYSKWFVITPYLVSAFGFAVLAVLLSYHLFAIDKTRIISASLSVLALFLLSLRGTIRYKRPGSVLLTTILFVMFAVTFLFFDRVQPVQFSWFYAFLFLLVEGILAAAAVMTFRNPDNTIWDDNRHKRTEYTETGERIVSLGEPVKKGIGHILFSRFGLVVLLLLLQLALLCAFIFVFLDTAPELMVILWAFTVIMIIYLINSDMDYSAKLTWMIVIVSLPFLGAILLLFTQSNVGHRTEKEKIEAQIRLSDGMLTQDESVTDKIEHDGSGTDDIGKYLERSENFPIFDRTEVTYFPLGENKFEAMLEELEKAEKYIFMEYFIVEEGYMWGRILDILIRKANEGVDVRVMYDGMCEISTLPAAYWKLLNAEGIKAKAFSPIRPLVSTHYNYRDHRKILVIDGKVAFNGGVNLADEYINRKERFGHWKDVAVMLKGDAAKSFALMFLQIWNAWGGDPDYSVLTETDSICMGEEDGYVMPYCDSPFDEYKVGETVYMDILNRATDYVHIMTPYLILDGELETALKYAALRGVDVRLILPGIPDKKIAYSLAKTHYRSLISSGVRIYEYTPGFVHAKVFVSDDKKAVVGTINLDYRSLYHHFECATYMYKTSCISEIERDFQDTMAKCREVTPETIGKEKLSMKIIGIVTKSMAPLL